MELHPRSEKGPIMKIGEPQNEEEMGLSKFEKSLLKVLEKRMRRVKDRRFGERAGKKRFGSMIFIIG
ncbi:MAG: hypothetical protein LBE49_05630 [Deltaproteobacteria bacterium]|nr:hypothetical protein [Deltaproteobacteria bacterium]